VDLEEFFEILSTRSDLPDGTLDLPPTPPPRAPLAAADGAAAAHAPAAPAHAAGEASAAAGAAAAAARREWAPAEGLEVELEDVWFGYRPERMVRGSTRAACG
jgi:hypothetical protein